MLERRPRWTVAADWLGRPTIDPSVRKLDGLYAHFWIKTAGARKLSLVALWDGKTTGDARGGTADMVRIAQKAGVFDVRVIDAAQLL